MTRTAFLAFTTLLLFQPLAHAHSFVELCESNTKTSSQAAIYEQLFRISTAKTCIELYEDLKEKKSISVKDDRIEDLSPLNDFKEINSIVVHSSSLWDISAMSTLDNLGNIELKDTGPVDFDHIKNLSKVHSVSLRYADNTYLERNLAILAKMGTIKNLYLIKMRITEAVQKSVAQMTRMKNLAISGDIDFSDIGFLQNMPDLKSLSLTGTGVHDLSPIKHTPNLKQLMLVSSPILSIEALKDSCAKMKWLALHHTLVQDFSPLKNCLEVSSLWLSSANITVIPDLTDNKKLRQLRLEDNRIVDLSPLEHVTHLDVLVLRNNRIVDVSPLRNMAKLFGLSLGGNPLGTTIAKTPENCPTDAKSELVREWCLSDWAAKAQSSAP